MIFFKRLSLVLLIVCFGFGCSQKTGSKLFTNKHLVSQIIEGKSTKADVVSLIGQPSSSYTIPVFSENAEFDENWTYMYTETKTKAATYIPCIGRFLGGVEVKGEHLSIYFKKGIVQKVTYGKSQI